MKQHVSTSPNLLAKLQVSYHFIVPLTLVFLSTSCESSEGSYGGRFYQGPPQKHMFFACFLVLTGFNLYAMWLLHVLVRQTNLKQITHEEIRLHPWLLNPFSERPVWYTSPVDAFRFAVIILIWSVGGCAGFTFVAELQPDSELKIPAQATYYLYVGIGIYMLFIVSLLIWRVSQRTWLGAVKIILAGIATIVSETLGPTRYNLDLLARYWAELVA